jgi:hypothetical protein
LVETAMVCQSGVAASRRNQQGLVSRIEYARAMPCRSIRPMIKIQDHHLMVILIHPTA